MKIINLTNIENTKMTVSSTCNCGSCNCNCGAGACHKCASGETTQLKKELEKIYKEN